MLEAHSEFATDLIVISFLCLEIEFRAAIVANIFTRQRAATADTATARLPTPIPYVTRYQST